MNTIGQFDGLDTFEWLDGLKKRLNIKEHRRIIQFESNPYVKGKNLIGALFTAISNNQVLALKYHTFKNPEVREVIVHPYLLKEYNNRWFVIVGAEDGKILNFALDRIDGFEPIPHIDYIEPDEELESRFEDVVGVSVYEDRPVENILLWVDEDGYQYIETKPLHESQRKVKGNADKLIREKYPTLQEGCFFRLQCRHNTELEQLLMSRRDQLVVLEPASLSNNIRNRIKKLDALYSNI